MNIVHYKMWILWSIEKSRVARELYEKYLQSKRNSSSLLLLNSRLQQFSGYLIDAWHIHLSNATSPLHSPRFIQMPALAQYSPQSLVHLHLKWLKGDSLPVNANIAILLILWYNAIRANLLVVDMR